MPCGIGIVPRVDQEGLFRPTAEEGLAHIGVIDDEGIRLRKITEDGDPMPEILDEKYGWKAPLKVATEAVGEGVSLFFSVVTEETAADVVCRSGSPKIAFILSQCKAGPPGDAAGTGHFMLVSIDPQDVEAV